MAVLINKEESDLVAEKPKRVWLSLWNHERGTCLSPYIALWSLQTRVG